MLLLLEYWFLTKLCTVLIDFFHSISKQMNLVTMVSYIISIGYQNGQCWSHQIMYSADLPFCSSIFITRVTLLRCCYGFLWLPLNWPWIIFVNGYQHLYFCLLTKFCAQLICLFWQLCFNYRRICCHGFLCLSCDFHQLVIIHGICMITTIKYKMYICTVH